MAEQGKVYHRISKITKHVKLEFRVDLYSTLLLSTDIELNLGNVPVTQLQLKE